MAGLGEMTKKTAEELNALKEEIEALNGKLAELTDEELAQVSGGIDPEFIKAFILPKPYGMTPYEPKIEPTSTSSWFA